MFSGTIALVVLYFKCVSTGNAESDARSVHCREFARLIILANASLSKFTRGIGDNINSVVPGFSRNPYNTAFGTGGSSREEPGRPAALQPRGSNNHEL